MLSHPGYWFLHPPVDREDIKKHLKAVEVAYDAVKDMERGLPRILEFDRIYDKSIEDQSN